MSFRTGHIVAYMLLLLLLVSCHKNDTIPQGSAMPIALQAGIDQTKGLAETTTLSLQTSGLGLFAWRTDTGAYFNGEEPYLSNEAFAYDGVSSTWKAGVYWPLGSWLSFFAYAPYSADVETGALVFPSAGYTSGYPTADYTPATDPKEQVDLVLSTPVLDRSITGGTVPLTFTHSLTKVVFKARWIADEHVVERMTANGFEVRITSIELENIRGTSTVRFSRGSYAWDSPAAADLETYATANYSLSVVEGTLLELSDPNSAIQRDVYSDEFVVNPDGILYLIPQALSPTALLRVTFGFYKTGDNLEDNEEYQAEFDIGMLDVYTWPTGRVLTYSISLDLTPGGSPVIQATAGYYEDQTLPGSESGNYQDDNNGSGESTSGRYTDGSDLSTAGRYTNGPDLADEP